MNPHRSTEIPTALGWLNIVQRGGTGDWQRLYDQCRDHEIAGQVAALLVFRDPDLMASARLWKFLLEDLHPDLAIDLRESEARHAM